MLVTAWIIASTESKRLLVRIVPLTVMLQKSVNRFVR